MSERVRQHPYSVILFDEIEKAHPDIFNVFLQILDDGRITDAQGRTIDFKNTVIIMTSNIGARSIDAPSRLGFPLETTEKARYEDMRRQVMEEVKRLFRPEFLNRVDEILVFHALNREHIEQIVEILFAQMAERMEKAVGVPVCMTEKAKNWIGQSGLTRHMGQDHFEDCCRIRSRIRRQICYWQDISAGCQRSLWISWRMGLR